MFVKKFEILSAQWNIIRWIYLKDVINLYNCVCDRNITLNKFKKNVILG